MKTLIYQIPFSEVQLMSTLLKSLEIQLQDKYIIDVELNSLEDAYLNIVNEEEIYVYLSGEFDELNDAVKEKYKLVEKGQRSIYVVRVIDNRKIVLIE